MNSKNKVAIKKEKIACTCMKCLKENKNENMHLIHILSMGYGSGFDMFDTIIVLCDDCYKESIKNTPNLWNMVERSYTVHYEKNNHLTDEERKKKKEEKGERISLDETKVPIDMQLDVIYDRDFDETFFEYEHEREMYDYINSLPIEGQELVYNRLGEDRGKSCKHDPQEWIDYHLGELSYELCKKNHWVFKGEFESYQNHYEKCGHVKNVIWNKGGKDSQCFINPLVKGEFGGGCSKVGTGCYDCEYFKERDKEIETVDLSGIDDYNETSKKLRELEFKERVASGVVPKNKRERLSIFKYKKGDEYIDAVVIRIENDKVLIVDREDFRDVLHDRKKAEDIYIHWIDIDNYCSYEGMLVEEREEIINKIEENAMIK